MEEVLVMREIYSAKEPIGSYSQNRDLDSSEGNTVFGTVLQKDFADLIAAFPQFCESAVFYDLGSGIGSLVNHVSYAVKPKKSCGIEWVASRHLAAVSAKEKLGLDSEFLEGSFFDFDISDATIVYVDNTMFSNSVNKRIYEMIPKSCLFFFRCEDCRFIKERPPKRFSCGTSYGLSSLKYIIKE